MTAELIYDLYDKEPKEYLWELSSTVFSQKFSKACRIKKKKFCLLNF